MLNLQVIIVAPLTSHVFRHTSHVTRQGQEGANGRRYFSGRHHHTPQAVPQLEHLALLGVSGAVIFPPFLSRGLGVHLWCLNGLFVMF